MNSQLITSMDLYHTTPAVLDGGLGTTLEDIFNVDISHTALWSAKASREKPETVIASHLMFLKAGAQIILTSTYQCSLRTYKQAGYSDIDAIVSMRSAVHLAEKARSTYVKGDANTVIKIALSLGPFGASLTPTQDFDGYYPPPFGPTAYSTSSRNRNSFDADIMGENIAVEALTQFHLERLLVFARDPDVWGMIDCIAFETIPLAREVKAIRRAMDRLSRKLAAESVLFKRKPWWISFVFPKGQCSEKQYTGGPPVTISEMVFAALGRELAPKKNDTEDDQSIPVPSGIGINCTSLKFFTSLVDEMSRAVTGVRNTEDSKPWLVLYPNGGDTYDPISRTWSARKEEQDHSWAVDLGRFIKEISKAAVPGVWSGIVGGGCCRTLPEQIGVLSKILASHDSI